MDVSNPFAYIMAPKEENELKIIQRACQVTCDVFNKYLKDQIMEIIDAEKVLWCCTSYALALWCFTLYVARWLVWGSAALLICFSLNSVHCCHLHSVESSLSDSVWSQVGMQHALFSWDMWHPILSGIVDCIRFYDVFFLGKLTTDSVECPWSYSILPIFLCHRWHFILQVM